MVGTADEHSRGFGGIRELIMHLSSRIDALDQKFSRYCLWAIGIHITILLAVIGALLSRSL